ncbi:MAG: zinc ribbon domain-containing protein [Clostridia bacterium]|jgi:hypothetical protein|nr:zinc ribbon domain-containing protein [Clostridia bacterium]
MYCPQCGAQLPENTNFCSNCGVRQDMTAATAAPAPEEALQRNSSLIGWSDKINDPAFDQYLKNTNRWAAIFAVLLAVVALIGFTIAGEMGVDNMENPQAFFYGLGVGGMFILIAVFSIIGRKKSKTWDGTVVDKTIKKKRRKQSTGSDNNDFYWVDYMEYVVLIQSIDGKTHRITAENDDTQYNYYQIGDLVRRHRGLNSYEKYDKSGDDIIFCNACATLCDINDETCFRCKCPLLK